VTDIASQKTVHCKRATLALIVRGENDEGIFDSDNQCDGPDDQGQGPEEVVVRRFGAECRRVDVQRGGTNVPIDDAR
jgi:hypothetical protein